MTRRRAVDEFDGIHPLQGGAATPMGRDLASASTEAQWEALVRALRQIGVAGLVPSSSKQKHDEFGIDRLAQLFAGYDTALPGPNPAPVPGGAPKPTGFDPWAASGAKGLVAQALSWLTGELFQRKARELGADVPPPTVFTIGGEPKDRTPQWNIPDLIVDPDNPEYGFNDAKTLANLRIIEYILSQHSADEGATNDELIGLGVPDPPPGHQKPDWAVDPTTPVYDTTQFDIDTLAPFEDPAKDDPNERENPDWTVGGGGTQRVAPRPVAPFLRTRGIGPVSDDPRDEATVGAKLLPGIRDPRPPAGYDPEGNIETGPRKKLPRGIKTPIGPAGTPNPDGTGPIGPATISRDQLFAAVARLALQLRLSRQR